MVHCRHIVKKSLESTIPRPEDGVFQDQIKKAEPLDPALIFDDRLGYFLNFLLNPIRPINPEPKRSMVAGSGTIAILNAYSTVDSVQLKVS